MCWANCGESEMTTTWTTFEDIRTTTKKNGKKRWKKAFATSTGKARRSVDATWRGQRRQLALGENYLNENSDRNRIEELDKERGKFAWWKEAKCDNNMRDGFRLKLLPRSVLRFAVINSLPHVKCLRVPVRTVVLGRQPERQKFCWCRSRRQN